MDILQVPGKSYKNAITQIFEIIIKIFATIFLISINCNKGLDKICCSLIYSDVISEFFSFLLNLILYHFDIKKYTLSRSYFKNMSKKIIKISFPVAITSHIRSGLSSLKQFLIPHMLELSGLNYSLAISSYGLINGMVLPILLFGNFFINSFSTLLVPEYSRLLAGKNYIRMKTICSNIFEYIFAFSFLLFGIFMCFPNEISLLVYKNIEIGKFIKIFSPLIIFIYIDNVIDNILKGINAQLGVMLINIFDLVITILIICFIVPIYGLNGYIFSIFVSEIFNFIFSYLLLKRKINFKFNMYLFLVKPCLSILLSLLITRLISPIFSILQNSSIANIFCFILIYIICLLSQNKNKL